MKVKDLIEALKKLPEDAVVTCTQSACCGCSADSVDDDIELDEETNTVFLDS